MGQDRAFLGWEGKWQIGTKNQTPDVCSSCLRTVPAAAVPVWRAPSADQSESQAPTGLPFSPGAGAPQASPSFCCFLLMTLPKVASELPGPQRLE